jgi:RNA polymerase sigma-70 factor (ECF subfamily)
MRTTTATKKLKEVSDKELALQMQTGTAAEKQFAFAELYKRFKDNIYITFFRALNVVEKDEVAKDLSQNTFMKVFNNISGFNDQFAFSTWIYTIAHNELIDFKRKQKVEVLNYEGMKTDAGEDSGKELAFQIKCTDKIADEKIMTEQKAEAIQYAIIKALKNEAMRDIVKMRYFDDFSYEEIAEKLDIPKGTVKSTLSRAKEILKDFIETKTTAVLS